MPESLSPKLVRALKAFASEKTILIALDFDGTLAPLVNNPEKSRMLPPVREALGKLTSSFGVTIAIVSGRSIDSLTRVADPPEEWFLVGSHGIEVVNPGELHLYDAPWSVPSELIKALEEVVMSHPGTRLELKPFGLALHMRGLAQTSAHSAGVAAERVFLNWDGDLGVRVGKGVIECSIQPGNKGDGLREIRRRVGPSAVLYAGDDETDEDGFAVLGDRDVPIHVGGRFSGARYRVQSIKDLPDILSIIHAARPSAR